MDIVHRAGEAMKFCTRLATLLRFALCPTQDMIKRQPALPRDPDVPASHPAHPCKTLRLHFRSPSSCSMRSERETAKSIGSSGAPPTPDVDEAAEGEVDC